MITNKLGLPQALVNLAAEDEVSHPIREKSYSVTELLKPTRTIALRRLNPEGVESDVASKIPAMLGTAVHSLLEKTAAEGSWTETHLSIKMGEVEITGIIDCIDPQSEEIIDWKTTTVSKIRRNDFTEWYIQGAAYAYLLWKSEGIRARDIRFVAIVKDWSPSKKNQPCGPIYEWKYQMEDTDYIYIEDWLRGRIDAIEKALATKDLPECSHEEMWYSGDQFAVYKNPENKRAAAVFDTETEAKEYLVTNKLEEKGCIVARSGEKIRCNYYCECKKICELWKKQ